MADAAGKNALLKSVLTCVRYQKGKKTKPADFQLDFVFRERQVFPPSLPKRI